ncbi:hypothetical protein P4530_21305 [Bacillus thuringiensis]|nr:hypothetical protein [Bacillus thuringiensis]MED3685514.1 hypothetical protein [Bacillus thuringiensis]
MKSTSEKNVSIDTFFVVFLVNVRYDLKGERNLMRTIFRNRETKKHINFKLEEIEQYIEEFKELLKSDQYKISQNEKREENIDFIEGYKIDKSKEKEILLNIEARDFCYAVDNKNPKFAHEKLYIFCPQYELDYWGEKELVEIYIKTNLIKYKNENKYIIIISFHKRNKPVTYLFR